MFSYEDDYGVIREHPINSISLKVIMAEPMDFSNERIKIDSLSFKDISGDDKVIFFDEQGCDIYGDDPKEALIEMCSVSEDSDLIPAAFLSDAKISDIYFSCSRRDENGHWHPLGNKPLEAKDFEIILNSRRSFQGKEWDMNVSEALHKRSLGHLLDQCVYGMDRKLLDGFNNGELNGPINIGFFLIL